MVTKWRTKSRNDSNGSSSLVVQESSAGSSGRLLNEFTIRIVTEYNCPLNQNHDSFPVKDYPFKITWFAHVCHQGYEFLRNWTVWLWRGSLSELYQRTLCELGLWDESYHMSHIKVGNYASAKHIIATGHRAKYSKIFFFNNFYLFVFYGYLSKK